MGDSKKSKRISNTPLKAVAEDGSGLVTVGVIYTLNDIDEAQGVLFSKKWPKLRLKPHIVKMVKAWVVMGSIQ